MYNILCFGDSNLPRRFEELCKRENVHFMNAGDYAKADDADGVHMGAEGHINLANAIALKVKGILKEN